MKILKKLGMFGLVALTLVACSEGNYTTPVTSPYTQTGLQTGFVGTPYQYPNQITPTRFYNPYLAANNSAYANLGLQANLRLQFRALPFSSCSARTLLPNFYTYRSTTNNCWARSQPSYTPTDCASRTGTSDCQAVLRAARARCVYTRTSSTTTTSSPDIEITIEASRNSKPAVKPSKPDVAVNGTATGTSTSTATNTNPCDLPDATGPGTLTDNDLAPTLYESISGIDAKALYDRLAREERTIAVREGKGWRCSMNNVGAVDEDYSCISLKEATRTEFTDDVADNTDQAGKANFKTGADAKTQFKKIKASSQVYAYSKTGVNYRCLTEKKSDDNYVCDIDISKSDGLILINNSSIKREQSAIVSSNPNLSPTYGDETTTVKITPTESRIKLTGPTANRLYAKLTPTAVPGVVGPTQAIQANIKTGKQVQCYETTNQSPNVVECLIKVKPDTGDALNQ